MFWFQSQRGGWLESVSTPFNPYLPDANQSYTIEAIAYTGYYQTINKFGLVGMGTGEDPTNSRSLYLENGMLVFQYSAWDKISAPLYDTVPEDMSWMWFGWHRFAATYDVATSTMSLYQDGILLISQPVPPQPPQASGGGISQFMIGTVGITEPGTPFGEAMMWKGNYSFSGSMGEVRIWNTARTQQELVDGRYGIPSPGPELAYYYKGFPFGQWLDNSGLAPVGGTLQVFGSNVVYNLSTFSFGDGGVGGEEAGGGGGGGGVGEQDEVIGTIESTMGLPVDFVVSSVPVNTSSPMHLTRTHLAGNPNLMYDAYFSDPANWKRITVAYKIPVTSGGYGSNSKKKIAFSDSIGVFDRDFRTVGITAPVQFEVYKIIVTGLNGSVKVLRRSMFDNVSLSNVGDIFVPNV